MIQKETLLACPSQFEGETDDGKAVYIRYRWGTLRMDLDGETVFSKECGGRLDGLMENGDLIEHLSPIASLPESCELKEDWD